MIRVRLTPNTTGAGGTKLFHVRGYVHRLQQQELELHLRDGRVCLQVIGDWEIDARPIDGVSGLHTCADAERIHDGHALILTS